MNRFQTEFLQSRSKPCLFVRRANRGQHQVRAGGVSEISQPFWPGSRWSAIRQVIIRFVLRMQSRFIAMCCQSRVTKERWAQIGITTEFLIVVRSLGEFFRLRYIHGSNFSTEMAALYVGGALIAACSCWAGVTFYFFRRYTLSAWITLGTVPILLIYKVVVSGR